MSNFLKPKSGVVYHCMPCAPVGECILPSTRCGGSLPADVRQKLGVPMEGEIPLIFASAHIAKAMAFGLQGQFQEKFFNMSIDGSDGEMVLGCDRKKMMARVRDVTIYEMPDADFLTLEYRERQCVSAKFSMFKKSKSFSNYTHP